MTVYSWLSRPVLHATSKIPAYLAIAIAVSLLSPVTILTVIPAPLHFSIALGIYFLKGSLIPTRPKATSPLSYYSTVSYYSPGSNYLKANKIVLRDCEANYEIVCVSCLEN